jgi:hypothetical protein
MQNQKTFSQVPDPCTPASSVEHIIIPQKQEIGYKHEGVPNEPCPSVCSDYWRGEKIPMNI